MTPLNLPLDGKPAGGATLIEASAGTGKTYALTTLAARLIVEGKHEIGNLLIVTFTVAATDELRDKIRKSLRAVLDLVQDGGPGGSDQARQLLARWQSLGIGTADAGRRLDQAVADLDRANVLTIHGFCQRVLQDFAFECALPFGFEVSGDGFDPIRSAVLDHWRRWLQHAREPRVRLALRKGFVPGRQGPWHQGQDPANWVARHVGKPDLLIHGAEPLDEAARRRLQEDESAWEQALDEARCELATSGSPTASQLEALRQALERPHTILLPDKKGKAPTFAGLADDGDAPAQLVACLARLDRAGKALMESCHAWLPRQRRAALEDVRRQVLGRIGEDRRLGYDDLLMAVHAALEKGPALAERIRKRYPFALIDEYQDTDRLQAAIFRRIYGRSASMVIVGDPKQSIYRFRGADIFAYLRARAEIGASDRISLDNNYRSAPGLVSALNALFGVRQPFGLPEVEFEPVAAAVTTAALRIEGEAEDARPLQFRLLPRGAGKMPKKADVAQRSAQLAAREIAHLLQGSRASIGERPVAGSDIAVLVRKKAQGRAMAEALRKRGVRSVEIGEDDVFATREAEQLERLLWALAKPQSADRVRGALASDLFGMDACQLARLVDDDDAWNQWRERIEHWRGIWEAGSVATMIRRLLWNFAVDATAADAPEPALGGAGQLLRHPDGARRLTNTLHLADLLQQAEAAGPLSPTGVATWLSRRRIRGAHADEVAQLRLESDERLVKIITIHRSKGLEFPIVFCPFAWDGRSPSDSRGGRQDAQFHNRRDRELPELLHLSPTASEHDSEWLEDFSEEVRLLYVALTRAQHRCVVTWAQANRSQYAPLAWLLRQGEDEDAGTAAKEDPVVALRAAAAAAGELDPAAWLAQAQALVERCPDGISAATAAAGEGPPTGTQLGDPAPALGVRELRRPLRLIRQMTSYSALAGSGGVARAHLEHEAVERPDRDLDQSDGAAAEAETEAEAAAPMERSARTFPAGIRVGNCLHDVFEQLARDGVAAAATVVRATLARHRIDAAWCEVAENMAVNAWTAPLRPNSGPGAGRAWRIADVARPVPELEFHLPVAGLDRRRLGRVLADHGYGNPLAHAEAGRIEGYLRGFIDLVAAHDNCWYVVDYKSNRLGTQAADYAAPRLEAAMGRQGYRLQFLLYLLALHRYLKLRVADYAYDRHVGGAFYLFVRGIEAGGDGQARGIHFDRPGAACIEAMDACFAGGPQP